MTSYRKLTMHTFRPLTYGLAAIAILAVAAPLCGAGRKLVFEDNFQRNESQEKKDEPGNGWGTNSNSRAGGNKQVDLKDGAMYIFVHPTADHAVSVRHDAEFTNGEVELRMMLENPNDKLGLDFADLKLKSVHAGHLFKVTVGLKKLEILDMKTGVMDLKIRQQRQAGKTSPELQKLLAGKKKKFPVKLQTGKWAMLKVSIVGDKITVHLDGKLAGSFQSDGFAHPEKRMLRLSVPKQAVVDDLKIYSISP